MIKIIPLLILVSYPLFSNSNIQTSHTFYPTYFYHQLVQKERKLDETEVKQRGIDIKVTEVIDRIDKIDLRKMARSAIFETSYGFRWKMFNVQTGKVVIIKVNKNFKLISVRDSKIT